MDNKNINLNHTSKFYKQESNNEDNNMFLTMNDLESSKKKVNIIFDQVSSESEDNKTIEINQNEYHENNNVFNNNNNNKNNIIKPLQSEEVLICEIPGNSNILTTKTNPAFPIESKISFKEDFFSPKINQIIEEKEEEKNNFKNTINSNLRGSIIVGPKNLTKSLEIMTGSIISHNGEDSYFPCFMCDKFYAINENNFPGNVCSHIFCSKCGKYYFEELIDNDEIKMKCPKFKCQNILTNDLIKKIVSVPHYNKLIQNIEKTKRSNNSQLYFENILNENNKDNEKKIKELQNYIYEHVIDVNSNKKFYLFNKAKNIYCNKCYEPALYSKSGNNFIKCLNCGVSICKYCFKNFSKDHLVISNENHCKVYLRKRYISLRKPSCFSDFFRELGLIIISYIMLFIGLFCSIYSCFACGKRIQNICIQIIIILFSLLFTLILSPFILILLPYFPVFNEIFF